MNPNPNPKIESYLGGGHELARRVSTTAGPPDGAARDTVAHGAGGRTRRSASACHQEAHQRRIKRRPTLTAGPDQVARMAQERRPAPTRVTRAAGAAWPPRGARIRLQRRPELRLRARTRVPRQADARRRCQARARRVCTRPAAAHEGAAAGSQCAAVGGPRARERMLRRRMRPGLGLRLPTREEAATYAAAAGSEVI